MNRKQWNITALCIKNANVYEMHTPTDRLLNGLMCSKAYRCVVVCCAYNVGKRVAKITMHSLYSHQSDRFFYV